MVWQKCLSKTSLLRHIRVNVVQWKYLNINRNLTSHSVPETAIMNYWKSGKESTTSVNDGILHSPNLSFIITLIDGLDALVSTRFMQHKNIGPPKKFTDVVDSFPVFQ